MRKNLTRRERLKNSKDIKRVLNSSFKANSSGMKLAILPNNLDIIRFGVSLAKKLGNSVQRNRIKRQVRENFRYYKSNIKPGFDLVFHVHSRKITFEEQREQILLLFKKVGLEA